MRKILVGVLFVSSVALSYAQSAQACVSLTANLSKGSESKNVLALQTFLYAKGFLKAVPNGYFGPGTFTAVKAYQKSIGLSQVGNTGPATRAAIKKDSCSTPVNNQSSPIVQNPVIPNIPAVDQNPVVQQNYPRPSIDSFDFVTLFEGGETDWTFNMYGNFSTSTNTVYFKNLSNGRTYTIGALASATGTMVIFPKNLTNTVYSCGSYCSEKLPAGRYEVTVATQGGQSAPKTLDIKAFTINAQTAVLQGALPASGTNIKLGSLTFSPAAPVIVRSVAMVIGTSTISSGGASGTILKDEITGSTLANDVSLQEFQSMIIGAYVVTNNIIPGDVQAYFTVEIEDYIGKKKTKFTSPSFLATVAGVL